MNKIKTTSLIILLAIVVFACSNRGKTGDVELAKPEIQDLEILLLKLLNKSVKEIESELNLEREGITLTDEPPGIIRGFLYPWNEEVTIQFMTGRLASAYLKKGRTDEESENSEAIDYQNLLNQKVIGINWQTEDSIFYVGTGFVWPHPQYVDGPENAGKLQRIKKEK